MKLCFVSFLGNCHLMFLKMINSEITELILTRSLNEASRSIPSLHHLLAGINQFVRQTRSLAESTVVGNILMKNRALIDFTATI